MAWQELPALRSRRGRVYQDPAAPHRRATSVALGGCFLHYESEIDSGQYDTAVDFTPQHVTVGGNDVWRVTQAGYHYALGRPAGRASDGWVGFGGRQGAHWLLYRLVQAGYLHWPTRAWEDVGGAPDYDRVSLSSATAEWASTVDPADRIVVGADVTWADIWTTPVGGVSLRWRVDGGRLKEDIILPQDVRGWIAANRPPSTPLDETYFGFVFSLDWSDVPRVYKQQVLQSLDADFEDDGQALALRDDLDRLLGVLPASEVGVWVDGEPVEAAPLKKRFWRDGDSYYLVVGVRADTLQSLPGGDLVFDPTIEPAVGASGDDGFSNGTSYFSSAAQDFRVGDTNLDAWFRFTPTIPAGATIDAAYLDWRAYETASDGTPSLLVDAEDASDPDAPTSYSDYASRVHTSASVAYNPGSVTAGTRYQTSDCADVIQELVDSYDYSGGSNHLQLFINDNGATAYRRGSCYDHTPSYAALLHIEYTEDSSVAVSPSPASAVGASTLGGVSAPVTLTPTPASAIGVISGPTVSASLTLTPDPASAAASTFSLYGVGAFYFEVAVDLDGDQSWAGEGEDVTGCVHTLDFSNGMSAAYQTLGKSQATLTLINVDGRFSPEHTNALSGFTLGRVVRVRVTTDGGVAELFRGAITKIDPRAGEKGTRRCTVTCEGWLARMRQQPFELPLQTNQRADQIAEAIVEAVGAYPPGYGSGDAYTHFEAGVETFPYFADNLDDNARVYDALRVLAASEATGRFYQERDGRLRFWDRRYLMKQYAVRATFEDTMAEMDYVYGAEIRNQVVVKYHPRQYEDDGPYVLSTHDEGIKFRNAQDEKEIYLRYSDESDITVSTTDPITPVKRTDYWGNNKEDGSGDLDFSNALSVSAEHFGTYSKWTVSNSGLSFWLAAGATQRGNDRITDRGRQEVRRGDEDSIAAYGLYPHTIDTQAQPSHNVARALAYWTVGKFSQPRGEIKRLTLRPLRNAGLRAQVVERQIGDRIRLTETQTGVDADYFIVGERWRVGEGAKEVEVSWVVEPAAVHQCLLMGVTGFCEMGSNSRMGF